MMHDHTMFQPRMERAPRPRMGPPPPRPLFDARFGGPRRMLRPQMGPRFEGGPPFDGGSPFEGGPAYEGPRYNGPHHAQYEEGPPTEQFQGPYGGPPHFPGRFERPRFNGPPRFDGRPRFRPPFEGGPAQFNGPPRGPRPRGPCPRGPMFEGGPRGARGPTPHRMPPPPPSEAPAQEVVLESNGEETVAEVNTEEDPDRDPKEPLSEEEMMKMLPVRFAGKAIPLGVQDELFDPEVLLRDKKKKRKRFVPPPAADSAAANNSFAEEQSEEGCQDFPPTNFGPPPGYQERPWGPRGFPPFPPNRMPPPRGPHGEPRPRFGPFPPRGPPQRGPHPDFMGPPPDFHRPPPMGPQGPPQRFPPPQWRPPSSAQAPWDNSQMSNMMMMHNQYMSMQQGMGAGGMDMALVKQWTDWYQQMVAWTQAYGPELAKQQKNSQEKMMMQQFQTMLQQYGQTVAPKEEDKQANAPDYHIQQMPVTYNKDADAAAAAAGEELDSGKKDLAKAAVLFANIKGINVEYKEPVALPEHLAKKEAEPEVTLSKRKQKLGIKKTISAADKKEDKATAATVHKQLEDAIEAKRAELKASEKVSHKSLLEQEKERLRLMKEKIATQKADKPKKTLEMFFTDRGSHEPPRNPTVPKSILKKRQPEPLPEPTPPPADDLVSLTTLRSLAEEAKALKAAAQEKQKPPTHMYDPFEAEDAAAVADERYRREEEERHRAAEVEEEEADWRRRSREWNRDGRYEHPGYDASNKRPSVEQNAHHYAREEEAREPPPKQPRNEVAEEQKMTIWVGNLPPGTKAIDIRELVSPYARVINCKVGMNKSQGSLFSLVTLNGSDASRCIAALNQTDFNGSQIDVRKIKT